MQQNKTQDLNKIIYIIYHKKITINIPHHSQITWYIKIYKVKFIYMFYQHRYVRHCTYVSGHIDKSTASFKDLSKALLGPLQEISWICLLSFSVWIAKYEQCKIEWKLLQCIHNAATCICMNFASSRHIHLRIFLINCCLKDISICKKKAQFCVYGSSASSLLRQWRFRNQENCIREISIHYFIKTCSEMCTYTT